MRLERVALRGVLRFTDAIALDLSQQPSGLVAVVGRNGEGKSTLLEAPLAALFRSFPSRAERELVDYAHGRDAFIEAVFSVEGRGTYRARVNLDGTKRASDAVLEHTALDGSVSLLNDGKVSTFDAAVAAVFPPQDVLLASAVAAQNRAGSFVTLDRKGRKDLFTRLLGLDRYEVLATTARQAAALYDGALAPLAAERRLLEREAPEEAGVRLAADVARLEAEAASLDAQVVDLEAARAAAQEELTGLRLATTAHAEHRANLKAAEDLLAAVRRVLDVVIPQRRQNAADVRRAAVAASERGLSVSLADIDERVRNNQAILGMAADIRAAGSQVVAYQEQLASIEGTVAGLRTFIDQRQAALREVDRSLDAVQLARRDLDVATRAAGLLASVPCHGEGVFAGCSLIAEAERARQSLPELQVRSAPALLEQLTAARAECTGDIDAASARIGALGADAGEVRRQMALLEPLTRRLAALEGAEARIAELTADREAAARRHAEAVAGADLALALILRGLDTEAAEAQAALEAIGQEIAALEALLEAGAAAARQLEARTADYRLLDERFYGAVSQAARARGDLQEASRALAAWQARRARLEVVAAQHDAFVAEAREWTLLARAFGRDGLPVLEIDAAGPTVSAYTNDLLAVCFGPRFTVELVTQAAKADGKGTKEVFELRVLDNMRGGDARDLADLSGGEQILVDEALKNALALFVNSRQAGAIETCWRDETTGPLDPDNASRYIEMLRRVLTLGGFRHILFVSHNAAAAALADLQVRVEDGRASVLQAPFEVRA